VRQEADKRAEQERRRAEESEARAQIEEGKTKPTTFEEYLRACHTELHHQPQEQALPDPVKTLDGLSSAAAAAFRNNLRIHTTRRRTFQLYPILQSSGKDLCDRPLASEKDLEAYQRLTVERPTTHIISHLQQIEAARREFN
jgi:hypothetical protein